MLEAIKSGRPEFIGRFLAKSFLSKKHPYACAQKDFQHIKRFAKCVPGLITCSIICRTLSFCVHTKLFSKFMLLIKWKILFLNP